MNGTSSNNVTYINAVNIATASWNPVSVSTTGVSGWFDGIAFGGSYFVAVGVGGQISYTQNLSNWTVVTLPNFPGYANAIGYGDVILSSGLGRFVAVGDSGAGAYTTQGVNSASGN
jgi:hypothetical protein